MDQSPTKMNAPCSQACPAGVDVPRYLRWIREGDFDQALAVIRERIPFPAVCGYVCVHPCETRCVRRTYDDPLAIRALKLLAATKGNQAAWQEKRTNPLPTNRKVAVIGAGPCGLTAAYYLAGKGHAVTVFEAQPSPGGLLRYGIPSWRLPKEIVDHEIDIIRERGVEITTGTRINAAEKLLAGYDAVVVATGAWRVPATGIEGAQTAGVLDGLSFLTAVNTGDPPPTGEKVVVMGGGNTALDAARSASRLGAREVLVLYRRGRAEMPANPEEVAAAVKEGVNFKFRSAPVKIEPGLVTCAAMTLTKDEPGRPVPIAGSEFTIRFDTLITAVGQAADAVSLGLAANADGTVKVEPRTLATDRPAVFAAGDAATGPSSLIRAMAQGRQVAATVDSYLGGDGMIDETLAAGGTGIPWEPSPRGSARQVRSAPEPDLATGSNRVELDLDPEAAVREASRCLCCDLRAYEVVVQPSFCKACGYCLEACDYEVLAQSDSFNSAGYRPVAAVRSDQCVGCLRCLVTCPDFAIRIRDVSGA